MNLIYVTQHFAPEIGAASFRATDLATFFSKYINVSVLTSIPNYPFRTIYEGYKNENMQENYDGCKVYRTKIRDKTRIEKADRVLNYLQFWRNSLKLAKQIEEADIVLGSIGPILVADIAYRISKKNRIPFVLEIRDLSYKQVLATSYGSSVVAKMVKKYEINYAKKADLLITVTEGYKKDLIENGINSKKIKVIKNGFNFEKQLPVNQKNKLYEEVKDKISSFEIKFGYYGTLGVSQDILSIVKKMGKFEEFGFLIIGQGAQYNAIKEYLKEEKISNIFLYPSIKEEELITFYNLVDYNLVILKNSPEFSYTIPSKIFEIMGYKSLPVFIGPDGEAANIVKDIDSRLHIQNIEDLKNLMKISQNNKEKLKQLAFHMCYEKYNRKNQATEYIKILNEVLESKREESN
jgi:colanic acid biosynthesis glycosyl transferase WcaI